MIQEIKAKIIDAVLKLGSEGATSLDIEKKVKLERHTLSKYLSLMEKEGILTFNQVGKGRIWFINKNPLQKMFKSAKLKSYNEDLFINLISKMPVGIMVLDKDLNVQYTNDVVTNYFGHINGNKFNKIVDFDINNLNISEIFSGKQKYFESKIKYMGNILLIKGSKLMNPDSSESIILILEDITQTELADQKIKKAYEKLKDLNNIKSVILHDVARDLKTPISLITMSSDTLFEEINKKDVDKSKLLKYITILQRNSKMFEEQITSILQVSKMDSEAIDKTNVDLNLIFIYLLKKYSELANEKHLEFKSNIDSNLKIYGNSDLIISLIKNLLSNAIKFTEKGSIEITCKKFHDKILLSVNDTGIGIKKENQSKVFLPFTKLDPSTEGLGVGLSICKQIVDNHNGDLVLESTFGKGTVINVFLPLKE